MYPVSDPVTTKPKGGIALALGVALIVVGIIAAVALVFSGVRNISSTINGYQRVPLSTGGIVRLSEPGRYRVFVERTGISSEPAVVVNSVRIIAPDGSVGYLATDTDTETYHVAGHEGRRLGYFMAYSAGDYQIRPVLVDGGGSFASYGQIAVGRRGPVNSILSILGGVFGGGAIVVAGVIFLIVGSVRRSRSRRAAITPLPGWSPPPGWSQQPPPPWSPPPGPSPGPSAWGGGPQAIPWTPPPPPPPPPAEPPPTPWSPTPTPGDGPSSPPPSTWPSSPNDGPSSPPPSSWPPAPPPTPGP